MLPCYANISIVEGGEAMEHESKWIRDIQRSGSHQAAERLVERYYDEIYVFTYRQTGHKEDAMDLTQSIFLAVLRALPSYDPKKASFRTWLYRIAANKVIDAGAVPRPRRWMKSNCLLKRTLSPKSTTGNCSVGLRPMYQVCPPRFRLCSALGFTGNGVSVRLPTP